MFKYLTIIWYQSFKKKHFNKTASTAQVLSVQAVFYISKRFPLRQIIVYLSNKTQTIYKCVADLVYIFFVRPCYWLNLTGILLLVLNYLGIIIITITKQITEKTVPGNKNKTTLESFSRNVVCDHINDN